MKTFSQVVLSRIVAVSRLPFFHTFYIQFFNISEMCEPRVLILGHSFIRRLNSFITDRTHLDHRFLLHEAARFKWHGVGGRTTEKTSRCDLHLVGWFAPHIVILQLGTNGRSLSCSLGDSRLNRYSVQRAQCAANLCLPNA